MMCMTDTRATPQPAPAPPEGSPGAPPPRPVLPPGGDPPRARPVRPKEIGGPAGPEPTRYGDWERKGRVSDF
jgi:homeobox protein ESX1